MTHVVIGGGGVLGSGFREALGRRRTPFSWLHPDWTRVDSLADELRPHLERHLRSGGRTVLVWAAGIGGVGGSGDAMHAETQGLRLLAEAVRALPAGSAERLALVFASSAGAVYAGHGATPVDESSPPAPTSAYGHVKLEQEQALQALASDTAARVLTCRYSNVYGLASGRLTPRGLVSTAVRATRHRQPMTVYVSPDSRRDYVYAPDAAQHSLDLLDDAAPGYSCALVCDGQVRTVSSVISLVGHVSGRRVPVAYAERPATRLQPAVLRFTPHLSLRSRTRATQMETAVHLMMRAPVS